MVLKRTLNKMIKKKTQEVVLLNRLVQNNSLEDEYSLVIALSLETVSTLLCKFSTRLIPTGVG